MAKSRYTMGLEEEVARLRAENRALVNSLLGTAGAPPLRGEMAAGIAYTEGSAGMKPVPPARRRSWQQIVRMLEIEEARTMMQRKSAAGVRPAQEAFAVDGGEPITMKPNGDARLRGGK